MLVMLFFGFDLGFWNDEWVLWLGLESREMWEVVVVKMGL